MAAIERSRALGLAAAVERGPCSEQHVDGVAEKQQIDEEQRTNQAVEVDEVFEVACNGAMSSVTVADVVT